MFARQGGRAARHARSAAEQRTTQTQRMSSSRLRINSHAFRGVLVAIHQQAFGQLALVAT